MRIHDVGKWQELGDGMALPLEGGHERAIRVEFNCVWPTAFFLVEDGVETFLGTLEGRDVLEFTAGGGKSVAIRWEGEAAPWYYTVDGRRVSVKYDQMPPTFTKIATRRQRNPDLARIEDAMRLNEMRREQQWQDELKRRREWERQQQAQQQGATNGDDTAAAGADGSGGEPEPPGAAEPTPEGQDDGGGE